MLKRLFLDVDDTIFDSENYVKSCLGGSWINYKDSIYLAMDGMTQKERDILSSIHLDYSTIPYVKGARLGISVLQEKGYDVTLCSCYWSEGEYKAKQVMADKLGLPIILCENYDKSSVDMRGAIFVDDSPMLLNKSSAEEKVCFYKRSNHLEDLKKGKIVYNWVELIHYLDNLRNGYVLKEVI